MIMVKANAKINLSLSVLNKKENGYHSIDTVFLPIELHDRVEFEQLPEGYESYITCDDISLPTDETNLAIKAFLIMRKEFNLKKNYRIHIHKIIPIGAGLGGGSANAASVIKTIIKQNKIKVSDEKLIEIAKKVGSDVPFFLYNKPARGTNEGEVMEFINLKKTYGVLIVKPKVKVSTRDSYELVDKTKDKERPDIDKVIKDIVNDDLESLSIDAKNDLESSSFQLAPEIKEVKNRLKELGCKIVLMSGSGAAVFALSNDVKFLSSVAKNFDNKKFFVKVTSTLK